MLTRFSLICRQALDLLLIVLVTLFEVQVPLIDDYRLGYHLGIRHH